MNGRARSQPGWTIRVVVILVLSLMTADIAWTGCESGGQGGTHQIHYFMPTGQEFIPAQPVLVGVDVWLKFFNPNAGSATITVNIRKGTIDGEIVASASKIIGAIDCWKHFALPSTDVIPGNTYVIEVQSTNAGHGWYDSRCVGEDYPGGTWIYFGGTRSTIDKSFRTYFTGGVDQKWEPVFPEQCPIPTDDILSKFELIAGKNMSLTTDPINIATGEMFVFATDFSIKGRGPTLELSRTYRSQTEFSGLFGYGWRSAYDKNLTVDGGGNVIIYDKDGVARYFTPQSGGTYAPSPGNYDTLVKNSDNTFTVTDKHSIMTHYNTDGRMTAVADRNGNTLTFVFNPSGGSYIEDAGGRRITLTLDANGRIRSAGDPAGHVLQYAYDTNGNLTTITNSAGNITHYVYDANHNITEMTNVNGHKTYFSYDAGDRAVMNLQDGDVNKVTLSFDSDRQTTVTDALGHSTVYEFNEYGLATSVTDPLGNTTTTVWDENLNRTSVTDARGNTTGFAYDVKGNLVKVTDASGNQTQFAYIPAFNLLGSVTDALGNITAYTYDATGNLLTITDGGGNQTQMSYDSYGNFVGTTNALGHTSNFEYDSYGQLVKTTDALLDIAALVYDAAGNNVAVTDPKGATTEFVYDVLNRLIAVHFTDGTSMSYIYDAFGNRLSVTDQKLHTATSTYDAYERLSQVTDALGGATQYTYDKSGNTTVLTDANGHTTAYTHDANGRLLSETTPLGHTTSYSYDEVGNLLSKTDANSHTITYTYDALNRPTRTQYPDGTSVAYSYDALGRQVAMTDWRGITLYSYDALGRLLRIEGPESNEKISYAYDALGNRVSMTNQDGQIVNYTYDALNRLITVTDEQGPTHYSYDALSNITRISYLNGASINYSYDVMNRPLLVVNKDARNKKAEVFGYVYDPAGMVTKMMREGGVSVEYGYDALNRLIREKKKQEAKKQEAKIKYDHQYSYDAVGNRVELIKHKDGEDSKQIRETYSYDAGNRLLGLTRNKEKDGLPVLVETVHYSYDNNGNRMSKEETKLDDDEQGTEITYYSYDYENRLMNLEYIEDPDEEDIPSALFEYDGNGIRRKAVEGNIVTRYYYDGLNVLFEKDEVGLTRKAYTRGLGFPGGIGGLISMKRFEQEDDGLEEKASFYHYDALGSVRGLSDQKGHLNSEFEYDAFGNFRKIDEGNGKNNKKWNTYRFSSKEFEDHAGLYYFGARYYDPETGRWLTPDPLGFRDGPNRYLYVADNPLNLIDPYGLSGERKNWLVDFFSPFGDLRYYYEVGAVMETKYTINMQDLFGQIGFGAGGYANVGYIPKGIGYSNTNFLEGGRVFYRWANQYGSGYKITTAAQLGQTGVRLTILGVGLSAYSLGETIDSYYYGYVQYKNKYGGR